MTISGIIFGAALAVLLGAVYHLWRGGDRRRLLLYLALAQVGFWGGHLLAWYLDWTFAMAGALHLIESILGAIVMLVLGDLVSRADIPSGAE